MYIYIPNITSQRSDGMHVNQNVIPFECIVLNNKTFVHRLSVTKYNGSQHSIPFNRVWSVSPLYNIPMMMTIIINRYIKGVFVAPQQALDQSHLRVCVCVCVLHLDDIKMRCNMHCTIRNIQKNFTNEIVELIVSCCVIWYIRFDDNHARIISAIACWFFTDRFLPILMNRIIPMERVCHGFSLKMISKAVYIRQLLLCLHHET